MKKLTKAQMDKKISTIKKLKAELAEVANGQLEELWNHLLYDLNCKGEIRIKERGTNKIYIAHVDYPLTPDVLFCEDEGSVVSSLEISTETVHVTENKKVF